jgi:hypothetical protein
MIRKLHAIAIGSPLKRSDDILLGGGVKWKDVRFSIKKKEEEIL